jgi:hypothetical protein
MGKRSLLFVRVGGIAYSPILYVLYGMMLVTWSDKYFVRLS